MTSSEPVSVTQADTATIARLDDGGPNAIGHAVVDGLHEALTLAEEAQLPLVILGRDGMLSAGFDLKVFEQGIGPFAELVGRGADLLHQMVNVPVPVIVGATGHAVAMGSLVLLAADYRVGAAGRFKVGLNEVSIGMALPNFAVALAADRLSKRHLLRATMMAELYRPEPAADAGFLDEVVEADQVEAVALAQAEKLSTYSRGAFAATKELVRADLNAALTIAVAADKAALGSSQ